MLSMAAHSCGEALSSLNTSWNPDRRDKTRLRHQYENLHRETAPDSILLFIA